MSTGLGNEVDKAIVSQAARQWAGGEQQKNLERKDDLRRELAEVVGTLSLLTPAKKMQETTRAFRRGGHMASAQVSTDFEERRARLHKRKQGIEHELAEIRGEYRKVVKADQLNLRKAVELVLARLGKIESALGDLAALAVSIETTVNGLASSQQED